ncbi:hypothetical protein BaRGS_00035296 [Batillaria attramentaria]|uniref:Helicase POLQ-like n=1 Tax=Batillaria attramentaria TaxID=370345 RepID=A0ABD0JEZ2_9CAEN
MNEQSDCKITRRVNYKTRKRSAESSIDDSDWNKRLPNFKRSSATPATGHGSDDRAQVGGDSKIACSAWIDNSFTNGSKTRAYSERRRSNPGAENSVLNKGIRDDATVPIAQQAALHDADCKTLISCAASSDDLNSSDLWVAEVNLSAIEAEHAPSQVETAVQLANGGTVISTHPGKNSEDETSCKIETEKGGIEMATSNNSHTHLNDQVYSTSPYFCRQSRQGSSEAMHSVVSDGGSRVDHITNVEKDCNLSGDVDLFDESMTEDGNRTSGTSAGGTSVHHPNCTEPLYGKDVDSSVHVNAGSCVPVNAGTGSGVPVNAGSCVPVNAGSCVPVNAGSCMPVNAGSCVPVNAGSCVPVNAGSCVPVNAGSCVPVNAGSAVPVNAGSYVPVNAGSCVPVNAGSYVPVNAGSCVPVNAASCVPVNAGSCVPANAGSCVSQNAVSSVFLPMQKISTPVSTAGGVSLKDKLKHRLLQNASRGTPTRNPVEELHKDSVSKAQLEASQIRREWSSEDVGPFYGLPTKVQELLAVNRKISKLYDWQDECLRLPAVYEGRNLIYTLPTSGGKTLVAEILILRQILCKKKDALLILPYISIVQEKVRILSEFATELGFLVEEYAGSKGRFPPTKRRQKHSLYIATIEKGQSLVNCLLEAERLQELGLVVVDELHMIGEGGSRGATMESTLLKILTAQQDPPQVIGMSATLNNIQDLAKFLHAEVFSSDFRPVSLTEYVKVEDNMYHVNSAALVPDDRLQHDRVITFTHSQESQQMDPDHLLNLVLEIVPDNSCLLFCPTKRYCENVALMLARLMCKHHRHLSNIQKDKRKALLQELYTDGGGKLCPTLKYTVHFGLAYHHSGLTADERRLIEDAYSDGILCLLTCTSTLAAGVNLPAKRVILRSPYVGADFLKHSQYKQMTGRAGRAGIDSSGESILISKKVDMPKVLELLSGPQDVCHSSLMYQGGKGLRTLILSLIGLKVVETTQAVFRLMQHSLLAVQAATVGIDVAVATREALQALLDEGLVVQRKHNSGSPSQVDAETREIAQNDVLKSQESQRQTRSLHVFETQADHTQACDSTTQLKGVSQHVLTLFPIKRGSLTQEEADTQVVEDSGDILNACDEAGDSSSEPHSTMDFTLEVTTLGKATFKGSVDLECGARLYEDLQKGEQSLVVANYLHLLYLVTPYDLAADLSPPWMIYLQQLSTLSPDEMKVADLVGVPESYIVKRASGQTSRLKVDTLVVQRFYLTLMLYDLWRQNSVWDVAERFQQPRGFVQNLLTSAASFASCVLRFCQELPELWAYQELLGNFAKRLAYCVSVELLPLMEVPGVKLGRARQLYSAGYQTLQSLAAAESGALVNCVQFLSHKAARQIISAAKVILEEKADSLLEQVEELVPLPPPSSASSAAADHEESEESAT